VPLKEVVSWLKRGQYVPFLREKRPFKKETPKAGANIGAITGNPVKTVYYRCKECSMNKNADVWLCHTTEKINGKQTVASCHLKYHTEMCFDTTGSATGSSVASGLRDE
jgi:hypothetical protein